LKLKKRLVFFLFNETAYNASIMAYFWFLPSDLSVKITLVPAFLLILSIVYSCNTLYIKSNVSLWLTPTYFDSYKIVWDQPYAIFFLIYDIPFPRNARYYKDASARSTALIFYVYPLFFAIIFLLSEALI
jgi:hypothetical protein